MLGAGNRIYLLIKKESCAVAESIFVPIPEKCLIHKMWSVIEATIDDDLAIALEIGGVAVTGGGLTVTGSGSAAGDVDSATPTALNEVAAGGSVEITFDGTPTTATSCTVLLELTKGT